MEFLFIADQKIKRLRTIPSPQHQGGRGVCYYTRPEHGYELSVKWIKARRPWRRLMRIYARGAAGKIVGTVCLMKGLSEPEQELTFGAGGDSYLLQNRCGLWR
jgi:hypothetical protein